MFTALSSQLPSLIMAPEIHDDPMEFLSRSWSAAATEVSKALVPITVVSPSIPEAPAGEPDDDPPIAGNPFSYASSATSQLVLERIMSQSHEVSPLTSGRLSHSSGPLTGDGSFSDSPPVSLSDLDDAKLCQVGNTPRAHYRGGSRTVGRWLKDRRERKKEETRAHNAHLHAAVSVAGVAAAVAAIASAAAATKRGRAAARTDAAVASAATLVAAQCVEAAEALGAEREHLAAVVSSAVSVRTPGDIVTLTAAAATALRGAATLKARILKEASNMAAVAPVEKNCVDNRHTRKETSRVASNEQDTEKLLGVLARGTELLKRTRKGALHWKVASVYIHRTGQVMLKTKSRHVAGTFTKKKKNVVTGVSTDTAAWPGRYLLDGAEQRRYFGLRTVEGRVIEFECRSQREYEMFTLGVSCLLDIVGHGEKHD